MKPRLASVGVSSSGGPVVWGWGEQEAVVGDVDLASGYTMVTGRSCLRNWALNALVRV